MLNNDIKIEYKDISSLHPYKNNPRMNEGAIDMVASSIRDFGFKVPIVIDKHGTIVCGHTRYEASKMLGLNKVPCVIADDLSEDAIKAFRIVDNRTAEIADWDMAKLELELDSIADFPLADYEMDWFTDTDGGNLDELLDGYEEKVLDKEHIESDYKIIYVPVPRSEAPRIQKVFKEHKELLEDVANYILRITDIEE